MNSVPPALGVAPLVSIIIPVFNGARYVAEAIDSALAQSHQNLEVIVVDDGSDDGGATAAICAEYGDQIRYFRKPNGGVASALNFGISKMSGSYFSWLSHDDRYLPDKVRAQLDMMLGHPEPVVVFGDAFVIDAEGKRQSQTGLVERWRPAFDARWLALEGRLSGCTLLIPRTCFDQCGVFDESRPTVQDIELWYRIGSRYKFVFCAEVLVESRVHPGQGSAREWHRDEATLTLIDLFKKYMRDRGALHGPDQGERAKYRFWRHHLPRGYPGLRRFCERLRLEGRQRCRVAVVDGGGGAIGGVVRTLVEEGFRDVKVVGRPVALSVVPEPLGPAADATSGGDAGHLGRAPGRDLSADLSELEGTEIVVLGFGDGRKLESLAGEMDRVIGLEADAVIWPASEGSGPRLAARASALRAALDRVAQGDPTGLPQELAMVAAAVFCSPPVPASTPCAEAATKPSQGASEKPVPDDAPRIPAGSRRPAADGTPDLLAEGTVPLGKPASGIVPKIIDESRPRPGTERIRRLLSAPSLGRVIQELAIGVHRLAPDAISRRAVAGVEWIYCARGRIDPGWYLTQYAEVRAEGWHPSLHYLNRGWREGKDPSPQFSTRVNAAFLPSPGHLNPLTRSAFAGRSFAMARSDHARWNPVPGETAAVRAGEPAPAFPPDAAGDVPDAAAAGVPERAVAAGADQSRSGGAFLILSDGSEAAGAWAIALGRVAGRRTAIWHATLKDGAVRDAVDAAGNPVDLHEAGVVETAGRLLPLSRAVDRIEIIGSVSNGDVVKLLSVGPVPYDVLPLSRSDVDTGTDLLRRAARVFAPSVHAKRLIDEQAKADAVLLRLPDFTAAVRFPVSTLDAWPGEALRVLAVSGSPSSAVGIVEVAQNMGREPIEILGTGPACSEPAIRRSVPWRHDVPLVELVGALDPHLIWLHSDLDFRPPCALVDVLRMGRPTLVSGAPVNWEGLAGRARTWNMVGRDTSGIVALLAGLAAGSSPSPEGNKAREGAGPARPPIEELL